MIVDRFVEAEQVRTEFRNRQVENPETGFEPGSFVTSLSGSGNVAVSPLGAGAYSISFSSSPNFTSLSIGGTPLGNIVFANKAANVPDTATSPGAAYVQAEVVSILTELRALKAALIAAGQMNP